MFADKKLAAYTWLSKNNSEKYFNIFFSDDDKKWEGKHTFYISTTVNDQGKLFSSYRKNDFYTFGESYAGHYVPAVTHQIWQQNKKAAPGTVHINLKGTSVGNGLTDPIIQYAYYPEMIISTNGHKAAVGSAEHALMEAAVGPCIAAIASAPAAGPYC